MSSSVSTDQDATAVVGPQGPVDAPPRPVAFAGERLGRFLVIEPLGRGGMGLVLRAYDPKLQREVALKLVRTDRLDAEAQARLVREARAMARLSHPHVVAIYDVELERERVDGGVLVVMEYVPGVTLDHWCRAAPRSWREVVEAFLAAGRGLAAAHAQGLLHRDFKPANVLVGTDGRVRVTDFGLARAHVSGSSSDRVLADLSPARAGLRDDDLSSDLTAVGTVMGTPAYMAPEQAEGGELDARVDQYAFCVALWEALAGRRPFQARGDALVDAKRTGPPKWPSEVAVPRHVVDAVRRGLAPRPADRFASVPELLAALQRDPSRARRRAAAVVGLVVAGLGALGWQQLRSARTQAACAAEGEAIAEVWSDARASEIGRAFEATGIGYAADTWSRTRARLDDYVAEWSRTRAQACEDAELWHTRPPEDAAYVRGCLEELRDGLEALLAQLADPDTAAIHNAATATASLPQVRSCTDRAATWRSAEPPSDPAVREEIAALRARLSNAAAARATGRYAAAHAEASDVLDEAVTLAWSPLLAEASLQDGEALRALGRYEDADAALQQAFFAAAAAARDEIALGAASSLVTVVGYRLARHDEGLHWGRLGQMLVDRMNLADDLAVAGLLANLAGVQQAMGAYAEAQAMEERALAMREDVLGPDHPGVASSLQNLGNALFLRGEYAEALACYERGLSIRERALGPGHPDVAASLLGIGSVALMQRDYARALPPYERALEIKESALGPDHPDVSTALVNLGNVRSGQGDYAASRALHERALAIQERVLGPDHPTIAMLLNNLANVHRALGDNAAAEALLGRALAIKEKALGPEHPDVATLLHNLGGVYAALGRPGEAQALEERALAIFERSDAAPSHKAATQLSLAGAIWDAGGDRVRAIDLATSARDTYRALGAEGESSLADAQRWLDTHVER